METAVTEERGAWLARYSLQVQWSVLLLGSIAIAVLLRFTGLPAALMLGPLIAAVLVQVGGGSVKIQSLANVAAQAMLGCMIAGSLTSEIMSTVAAGWPLFLTVVVSTVLASGLLGWLIGRAKVFPGSTAVWGLSPGAASIMVLMADEYGADGRLVAFMQYLRVVCVAATTAVVARLWVDPHAAAPTHHDWFPPMHWWPFATTLAIAAAGAGLGAALRIPGGLILGPLFLGGVLHACDLVAIEIPPWLLTSCYFVIGWRIGLTFTRPILAYSLRTLPQTLLSIFALIGFCGGLAMVLSSALGVDPLTAYLAASPGGVDSVAIIAAGVHVDLPFIMTLQTIRVLIVLVVGPPMARWIAARLPRAPSPADLNSRSS